MAITERRVSKLLEVIGRHPGKNALELSTQFGLSMADGIIRHLEEKGLAEYKAEKADQEPGWYLTDAGRDRLIPAEVRKYGR